MPKTTLHRHWTRWVLLPLILVGAHALAAPGLSANEQGELLLRGVPFCGIGVNYYDAFVRTLEQPPQTNYAAGFRELANALRPMR